MALRAETPFAAELPPRRSHRAWAHVDACSSWDASRSWIAGPPHIKGPRRSLPALPFRLFGHLAPLTGNLLKGSLCFYVTGLLGALLSLFCSRAKLVGSGHGRARLWRSPFGSM